MGESNAVFQRRNKLDTFVSASAFHSRSGDAILLAKSGIEGVWPLWLLQAIRSSSPSSSAGRAELANKAHLDLNGVHERDAMTGGAMKVTKGLGSLMLTASEEQGERSMKMNFD